MEKLEGEDAVKPFVGVDDAGLNTGETVAGAIQSIVEEFDVQPVLFVGSGLPRRYTGRARYVMLLIAWEETPSPIRISSKSTETTKLRLEQRLEICSSNGHGRMERINLIQHSSKDQIDTYL
jgi:hypothetical protein